VPWHRIAVLFRTNAQSSRFETAFTRRGVPFRIGEGQRFATRPPVAALLDRLRDSERKRHGRPFAHHLADLASDDDAIESDEARAHRDALLDLGRDYIEAVGGIGGVGEFAIWLDTATGGGASARTSSGAHGVDLVTFHRAKGLEWTVVFVTGLEQGLVPISWSTSDAARTEERRLLHVALSRADNRYVGLVVRVAAITDAVSYFVLLAVYAPSTPAMLIAVYPAVLIEMVIFDGSRPASFASRSSVASASS